MNRYRFEDISIGLTERFTRKVTEEMMESFYQMTGDENPLHRDDTFAKRMGFSGRVVYGMLTASFLSTLAGVYLPGERSLIHKVETEFPRPVRIGDELTVTGKVSEINETFRFFVMKVTITNQEGKKVCRGKMQIGFLEEKESEETE